MSHYPTSDRHFKVVSDLHKSLNAIFRMSKCLGTKCKKNYEDWTYSF